MGRVIVLMLRGTTSCTMSCQLGLRSRSSNSIVAIRSKRRKEMHLMGLRGKRVKRGKRRREKW